MSLFILDDMIVDESESHENKRVKITTACDTCRRRKVKCDGAFPCANCTRGAYQCTFSDASTKRPRGPPKGFVALIEDRLHTIESLLVNLVNKDNINENNKEIKRERENAIIEESNQRQRFSTFKIRQYSPTNVIAPAAQSSSPHLFIPTTPPADANYSSDQSPSLISGFVDDLGSDDEDVLLQNLVAPNSSNSLQSSTLSFLVPNNQQSGSYVDPPIPFKILPPLSNPSSDISRQLLEKYFNHFHPYFPIINRGQLYKMMSGSKVEDQPSPLLINAIYAIGAMFPPTLQDSTHQDSSSLIFYNRAKNLLDFFIDVPRLSTVQALILLCMVDQGKPSSYRPQTYSSMAIRMAQSLGLNRRNGAVYQGKGRQTKKLIWWGCFITDRLNSLANGDPLAINDKMCDVEFPSPDEMDDQDDDNQSHQQNSQQSSSTYAQQINIFVNFVRLAKIIGQIIEHLQSTSCIGMPASWTHHAMVNNFEILLLNWLRELPPFLQYAPSPNHMPLPGQIASLHMHHQTLFLILHYPYIASHHNSRSPNARMSKTFIKSLNACSAAAHVITHIGDEALNNVHVCITFPIMFYSLGKAAKVHVFNLASQQRGLALNSYRNIVKTIKICRFYEENNIMAELANQMISSLDNVLMSYQDKFSNEETIEISSISPTTSTSTHVKVSPTMTNQMFHPESISSSSKPTMQTMDPKREQQQQASNFAYIQNQAGGMQQFMPVFDPYGMQMQSPTMMMSPCGNEMTPNEPQFWDIGQVDNLVGGFNNNPYNNIPLSTAASSAPALSTTTTVVTSATDYFSHQQQQPPPQRQSSLPVSSPIPMYPATSSTKTHSRSNQMSLDSIEQDNDSGSSMMNVGLQNIHPSQRYVFMDTSDNNSSIVNENGGGRFVIEGDHIYGHLSTSNETHQRIFNKIPRRMRKKEGGNENGQIIATGSDHQQNLSNKDAIIVLSRRSNGNCGVTPNGFNYGGGVGSNENGNISSSIGFGYEANNFNHNHIDSNVNNNNSMEMKEVNVGFNTEHYRKV